MALCSLSSCDCFFLWKERFPLRSSPPQIGKNSCHFLCLLFPSPASFSVSLVVSLPIVVNSGHKMTLSVHWFWKEIKEAYLNRNDGFCCFLSLYFFFRVRMMVSALQIVPVRQEWWILKVPIFFNSVHLYFLFHACMRDQCELWEILVTLFPL